MTQSAHNTRLEITESMRHTQPHHHISTQILGITAALGTHTHTQSHTVTSQPAPVPNTSSISVTTRRLQSAHIYFPPVLLNGPLWSIFTFAQAPPLSTAEPGLGEWMKRRGFFFFFLHCLGVFNGHNSEDSKHLPRWFVYYVNQLVIRGVEGVITFYSQTSLMY